MSEESVILISIEGKWTFNIKFHVNEKSSILKVQYQYYWRNLEKVTSGFILINTLFFFIKFL